MSNMLKKWTIGLLVGAMTLSLVGCGGNNKPAAPAGAPAKSASAKIGVIAYLSGAGAAYGEAIRQGLELARDEINAQGKTKIELIFEDSKGEKNEAINAANK